jgi:glycosyltransferase involved in cell wall biosynthesis
MEESSTFGAVLYTISLMQGRLVDVIIPAYNEEASIGSVLRDIPAWVRSVIVVNNNSSDNTKAVATAAGAIVVDEAIAGYGKACLKGIDYISRLSQKPDIAITRRRWTR